MEVLIEKRVLKTLEKFPMDIREYVFSHFYRLEDPYNAPDTECLHQKIQVYRMHVGRSYTIIFKILKESKTVHVLDLMTIEQAHKRYGRFF